MSSNSPSRNPSRLVHDVISDQPELDTRCSMSSNSPSRYRSLVHDFVSDRPGLGAVEGLPPPPPLSYFASMSSISPSRNLSPVHGAVSGVLPPVNTNPFQPSRNPSSISDRPGLGGVEATGEDVPPPVNKFEAMGLGEILKSNISRCGYVKPTPFQRHAIPVAMTGRDLIASAQASGCGKTEAFCIPIISGVLSTSHTTSPTTAFPKALIFSPTTQSAVKIHEKAKKLAYQSGAKITLVCDGVSMAEQDLERGVDILVGTPGCLVDLIERSRSVSLKMIKFLALFEADKMLDMGFELHIRKIFQQMDMPPPGARQTLLFSATFPTEIQRLASDLLNKHIFLKLCKVGNVAKGTTTLAFMSRTMITVAADSRTTRGEALVSDTAPKLYTISKRSNLHCTSIGLIRLWEKLYAYVKMQVEMKEDFDHDNTTTATEAASFVVEYLDNHYIHDNTLGELGAYGMDLIGWPMDKNMEVISIPIFWDVAHPRKLNVPASSSAEANASAIASQGSGSSFVLPNLYSRYDPDIEDNAAADVAMECLFRSSVRDIISTGGSSHVYHIGQGTFVEKLCYNSLECHAKYFGTIHDRREPTIFLIQPIKATDRIDDRLSLEFLKHNWEHGNTVKAVILVAVKEHSCVYRLLFGDEYSERDHVTGLLELPEPVGTCHIPVTSIAVLHLLALMSEPDGSIPALRGLEAECSITRRRNENPGVVISG